MRGFTYLAVVAAMTGLLARPAPAVRGPLDQEARIMTRVR